jgi:hypothetical protein
MFMAKKIVISLALFAASLAGCDVAENHPIDSMKSCDVGDNQFIVWVSTPSQERVEITTKSDIKGCSYEQTIIYLYEDGNAIIGVSSLPLGYNEAQCQWDACGGPLGNIQPAINPVE